MNSIQGDLHLRNDHHNQVPARAVSVRRAMLAAMLALATTSSLAASLYWDANGSAAGSGGATPIGTWGVDNFWSTASGGNVATAGWTPGETAVFSASNDATGTFTVNVTGTQVLGGLAVEEGNVTLSGGILSLNAGASVSVAASRSLSLSSEIAGAGWAKIGGGNLSLNVANSFTGPLTINGSAVRFNHSGAAGFGSIIVSPTSDVFLQTSGGSITITNPITLNSAANVDVSALSGTLTLNGDITGPRSLWSVGGLGANTVVLGGNNSFSGNVDINGGTLIVTRDNALGTVGGTTKVGSGATLGFQGDVAYNAAEVIKLFGDGVGSMGALQNLGGDNQFFGPVDLQSHATIGAISGSLDLGGTISGSAFNLTKVGVGRIIISGLGNSFAATTVNAGTLQVESTLGSGTVTVAPNAVIAGNGTIAGAVQLSGQISPSASPGTLSTGSETWEPGASYLWEINEADFGLAGDSIGWDLADIDGTLTINATSLNKFLINVVSLDPFTFDPGDVGDFDNTVDYSFLIATTTGGITGFDPAKFEIDSASFSNALGFGTFVVEATATELFLSFVHPPFIVTSPVSVTKQCSVDSASFVVVAGGSGSLNYQWTRNGVPLANSGSVSGADTTTLMINPVVLNDSANYACVVTNIYGITTSAVAVLTVVDTIAPILVCPADVSVNADAGECYATGVALGSPGVTEACDIAPTLTNNAPMQFPVGTTVVTWGVTDGSGNHAECQQNVTVVDNQSPTLTVNSITRQLDNAGNYTLTAADLAEIVSAAADNCGLASTNASQTVFNFCHVAANNVTITVTDIHGNAANAVVVINITAPPPPTVVYVDDDYPATCAAVNFPSNGVAGPYYVGFNAFNTIQAAVDAVAAGGTVNVAAGEYSELVEIGKAVSVLGPNAGINPNTGTRVAEAILRPDASNPDPLTSSVVLIYVTADDVTVRGLSLDGDSPAFTSGVVQGGADIDAIEGIASYEGVGNIVLENNIIKNLSYTGVEFYNYYNSGAATSGNSINANRFLNIGTTNFGYGMAILIYNNFYTEILGNHMLDVRLGIQTGNYSQANPGPTAPVIAGNQISSWRRGVFYNLHYASASPFSLTNNVITAQDSADVALWDAMLISSQQGSVTSVIGDNTINGAAASQLTVGYQVWNCPATAGAVFTGGTITDCDYGVWINNYDGYVSSGDASTMTVNGVEISGASLAGVYVKDNALNSNGATVHAILNGGSVSNSAVGVLVDGADASIAPGNVALGNLSSDYIQLVNGASQNADATSVLFDGATGASMSLATLFATEDRIDHAPDFAGLGLVRVNAGNVYVTTNSGSIQRGINPASSGDTVNVNDGSYDAQVSINKTITLISANGSAVTTIQDSAPISGLGTIQVIGPTTGVQIGASGRGFTINGIDSPNPGIEWAAVYFQGNHTNAAVIGNQIIAAGDAGLMTEFSPVIDTLTVSENEFSGQTFIGPTPADLGFGNQFTVWNVPRQLAVISSGSGGVGKYNITFTCNFVSGTAGGLNPTNAPQGNTLVTIDSVGSTIENNTFTGVTTRFAESLRVRGPGANIAGNTFAGSSPVALQIYSAAAATAQVTNNSFATNYSAALVNLGVLLNGQNNWWGSASGPAHVSNPGGSGAIVLGSVDLSPWLGSASDVSGSCGFQPDLGLVYYLPDHLIFSTQPGNAALNSPLSTQPVVQVIDENGGLATQFNGVVTLTIGSNPGGGVLAGTVNIPVVGGVATFTDLSITVGGGVGYTLVAATAAPVVSTNSASFDIGNSMPGITSLNPFWKRAGEPAFTLTVTGSNFVFLSEVLWDGSPRPTTYVNPTTVTALISASDIVAVGTASVSVSNPPPAGGVSGALTFRIEAAVPAVVYVDDDYTNNVVDDLVNFPDDGGLGTHIIGYDAFATLQAGINAVTNTGTEYVAMGNYNEDVNLNKPVSVFGGFGGESVVIGPIGGAGSTFTFAATGLVLDGVTITRAGNNTNDWNNGGLNSAGVAMQGAVSGTVRNCLITGMRTAIDINNSGGSHILNNVITNNRTGLILRNQTDNLVVAGNSINDNWTVGVLFLDASSGSNVPLQTAANCSFISNSIAGNWYGEVVDRQTGGSLPAPGANLKNFSGNWLGTNSPVVTIANSAEPGYPELIPVFYGGTNVNPGGAPTIAGTASANIDYTPWLEVGTDTGVTFGFQGDFTTLHVDDNSSQVGSITRIQEGVNMVSGSTVLVEPGNYSENVSITSNVTIDGAGSGTGAGDSIVIAANPALPVFLVTDAGGTGAGDRLTIKDLRVTGGADGVRVNSTSGTNQWYRIENVTAVNNSSSGVLLTGGATLGEVEVTGSVLSSNGIFGLHVANTLALFASLNISGGSMDQNGANGLSVYGLDSNTNSPTDISVTGTSFANNGNPLGGGEGDLSFFLFNGNAAITNVTVTADAQFPIQFRGKGTAAASSWSPLGVVHLEDVTVTGNTVRPGLYIVRYSDVSNVSFADVDLSGLVPPSIPSGFASVMQVIHSGVTPLNLHGLTLKATYFSGPPAGYGALAMLGTGGAVADCSTVIVGPSTVAELEASVFDQQDTNIVGDVVFPVLTLTPIVSNVIAECTGGGAATVVFADPTATADCLPLGPVVSTPASGSVFNLGTNVVTAWVTDNRGISNSVTFLVTVLDTTAPEIIACAPVTNVLADANCLGTTPDLTGLVLAADGCDSGPLLITQSPITGTLLSLGAHPVTLTVTDPSGNFSNCVTTVTVIDLTAPVVTFWPTNRTLSVGAGCDLLVPDLTGEVVATDNCSPTNITQSPLAGTVVSYGVTPVTVTVADQYGNFTNNVTSLTVVDTSNPSLTCPADVVVNRLDATDPYATGFATATDNCTNVVVTYDDNRNGLTNCNSTGIIYRTWTATDSASNATTCVQTITIIDTLVPLFTSIQVNLATTNDAGLCSAEVTFPTPTAVDVGYSQGFENPAWASGNFAQQPSVDWNAYSSAMNRVPSGTDGILSKSGVAHAVIDSTVIPASPFDYTGVFGRLGAYSKVFGAGFRSSVDVYLDLSNPAVAADTYGWNVSTAASTQSGGHLRDFVIHASSDTNGNILIAADNNSNFAKRNDLASINHYTVTNSGWYTLEWVFRDNSGVLAVDCNLRDAGGLLLWTETRSDPSDLIATVVGGNRYMWFTFLQVDKLAVDNTYLERNAAVVCDPASGTPFPVGTNEVTCVATDACGNTTTNIFTITVNDVETPTITCPAGIVQNADAGECFATVALGAPTVGDNCGIAAVTNNAVSQTQFPVGTNLVTWTVTDVHSNTATCLQTVIVVDDQLPQFTCPSALTNNADLGQCSATFALPALVATDNCGVASVTSNAPPSFPVGLTPVTWTVVDIHGNTNACIQIVAILDPQLPQVTAGSIAACYETSGLAEAAAIAATAATDNCGVASTSIFSTVGTCSATITVRVTDIHGNFADVIYNTRIDAVAPVIGVTTATEVQLGGPVNVKNNDCLTNAVVQGTVLITVDASDNCSFVGGQPSITLVNGTNTETAAFVIENPVGTYNYTWDVTNTTADGTWIATVAASDICHTTTTNFTLCVNKTQVTGLVQLEGFTGIGGTINHARLVTFVATGGVTNKTWNLTLTNVSGDTFSYTLTDVPAGTTGISAKTAWNLREKLAVTLDINGQATADFVGTPLDVWSDTTDHYLRGGDFTADNQVQFFDYSILGNNFFTANPVADITGDDQVDYDDFFIMYLNWFKAGDPQ
jgi:autotransporter-associated beta strand protein